LIWGDVDGERDKKRDQHYPPDRPRTYVFRLILLLLFLLGGLVA